MRSFALFFLFFYALPSSHGRGDCYGMTGYQDLGERHAIVAVGCQLIAVEGFDVGKE